MAWKGFRKDFKKESMAAPVKVASDITTNTTDLAASTDVLLLFPDTGKDGFMTSNAAALKGFSGVSSGHLKQWSPPGPARPR